MRRKSLNGACIAGVAAGSARSTIEENILSGFGASRFSLTTNIELLGRRGRPHYRAVHHHASDQITRDVDGRAAHVEEPVDAEDERDAARGYSDRGEKGCENDEADPRCGGRADRAGNRNSYYEDLPVSYTHLTLPTR